MGKQQFEIFLGSHMTYDTVQILSNIWQYFVIFDDIGLTFVILGNFDQLESISKGS